MFSSPTDPGCQFGYSNGNQQIISRLAPSASVITRNNEQSYAIVVRTSPTHRTAHGRNCAQIAGMPPQQIENSPSGRLSNLTLGWLSSDLADASQLTTQIHAPKIANQPLVCELDIVTSEVAADVGDIAAEQSLGISIPQRVDGLRKINNRQVPLPELYSIRSAVDDRSIGRGTSAPASYSLASFSYSASIQLSN